MEIAVPDFWDDPQTSKEITRRKAGFEREYNKWLRLESDFEDIAAMFELAAEDDEGEFTNELAGSIGRLEEDMEIAKVERTLSGVNDACSAIIDIHPGAGGTESQDWAQMLFRMYCRWVERNEFKMEIIDLQPGDEAGIKSVIFSVVGEYAFGYLRGEAGVHRLVRISPFDANKRRHTSFASVYAYPDVEDTVELDIDEKDLRIDTYRASGAGGQHVNKTSSAVRITHLPTGIAVQCQNERSQHKNKSNAMKVLKARLYELEEKKKEDELSSTLADKKDIAWGSQIRSYVFQPYQMVKDHRTGIESGNISAVMDGDIAKFIRAYLSWAASKSQAR